MRTGLSLMSGMLAEAQQRAEPAPDDPKWTFDSLVGPALGHTMTAAERIRSHERLAKVVAELAAGYTIADRQSWPLALPDAPPGLPGSAVQGAAEAEPAGQGGTPLAGHVGDPAGSVDLASAVPGPSGVAPAAQAPVASTLAGAGSASGAGSTLAGAGGYPVGQEPRRGGAEGGPTAGQAPIPPMMGAGPVADQPAAVAGYQRPYDEGTSWIAGEQPLGGDDEHPPPAIGDLTLPA
jgi:hypothetical protein